MLRTDQVQLACAGQPGLIHLQLPVPSSNSGSLILLAINNTIMDVTSNPGTIIHFSGIVGVSLASW